jgi:hypothetical protein
MLINPVDTRYKVGSRTHSKKARAFYDAVTSAIRRWEKTYVVDTMAKPGYPEMWEFDLRGNIKVVKYAEKVQEKEKRSGIKV